ncbi:hypothetical protein ACFE04_025916 [Oxalis oulophora]
MVMRRLLTCAIYIITTDSTCSPIHDPSSFSSDSTSSATAPEIVTPTSVLPDEVDYYDLAHAFKLIDRDTESGGSGSRVGVSLIGAITAISYCTVDDEDKVEEKTIKFW